MTAARRRRARHVARPLVVLAALGAIATAVAAPARAGEGAVWIPTRSGGVGFGDFALANDDARGQLVAFASNGVAARTLTFDGTTWTTRATTAIAPPPRVGAAMAYDAARAVTVLFGGNDETWTWNGSAWTLHLPAVHPSRRVAPAMAYDESRQVVVLFGGRDPSTGAYLDDLWEWDGAAWTEVAQASFRPAARAYAAAAWSGELVLFGGSDGRAFNDCWTYAGAGWTRNCSQSITSRQGATMATDPHSGTVVMWGGHDQDGRRFTDTWLGTRYRPSYSIYFRESGAPVAPPYDSGRLAYHAATGRMTLVTATQTWFFDTLLND